MQTIRIVSRKYDGRLRDEYEAFLYAEAEAGLPMAQRICMQLDL